jgi:response regulator NasT
MRLMSPALKSWAWRPHIQQGAPQTGRAAAHPGTRRRVPVYIPRGLRLLWRMNGPLSIAVIENDPDRAALISESLHATGNVEVHVLTGAADLAEHITGLNPDVVLIDISNPSRDMLEAMAMATGPLERPVAMFVDRSDESLTRAAIEAGVSAYVVDGLHSDRLKPILDAAVSRFNMFSRMRTELETTKRALEERKVIDRAKGLLMKARGIDEDEAYALLRKTAMDQGKRLADVAQALVTTFGLLS